MRNLKMVLALVGMVLVGGAVLAATWIGDEREQRVTLDQLPAEVMVAVLREAGTGEILEIVRDVDGDRVIFEAEIRKDGRVMEIEFAADGTVLEREEGDDDEADDEDDDGDDEDEGENEQQGAGIPAQELPNAARLALAQLVGHEDFAAWTERVHGTTVYEARWVADGRQLEAEVTEEGVLLEIEEIVPADAVPEAVRRQAEQQLPDATELRYVQITVFTYEVEAVVDGRSRELKILPTGRVVD